MIKPTANALAEGLPSEPIPTGQQEESFIAATSQYFAFLSSVDVNLRRQIYALEEADILPAEVFTKEPPTSLAVPSAAQAHHSNVSPSRTSGGKKGSVTGGGLGNLDVGWLNSRNDNVGKDMKSEVWRKTEKTMNELEERKPGAVRGYVIGKRDSEDWVGDGF